MAINRFTNEVIDIQRGETDVIKVYLGETLVWEPDSIKELLILGGSASSGIDNLVTANKTDGSKISGDEFTVNINALEQDNSGKIYVGHDQLSGTMARVLDRDYNVLVTIPGTDATPANARGDAIAVDDENNILVGAVRFEVSSVTYTLGSFSSAGVFNWGANLPNGVFALQYHNNKIYAGLSASSDQLRTFTKTGTAIATASFGTGVIRGLAVDKTNGDIIAVGNRSGNRNIRRYDSDLSLIYDIDFGASTLQDVAIDPRNGDFVTGGSRVSNITIRKYTAAGTLVWSRDTGSGRSIESIDIDKDGNVYAGTAGTTTAGVNTLWKWDSDGNQIFAVKGIALADVAPQINAISAKFL